MKDNIKALFWKGKISLTEKKDFAPVSRSCFRKAPNWRRIRFP